MLQQTQAARIVEHFEPFLARFPTPAALAAASLATVLAMWSGLGYNRRALALRRAAAQVAEHGWPTDLPGLQRLPGVGPYTARAVASLAFGAPVGVVDTNVRRWLLRRFGVLDQPSALQATGDALAGAARDADEAATWTHASMEFGARVCRSRRPRCDSCPIASACPSRHAAAAVQVPRQPAFGGSMRARRGALVRALARARRHELPLEAARSVSGPDLTASAFERLLSGLERDGLVHWSAGLLRLGGPEAAADTIGP